VVVRGPASVEILPSYTVKNNNAYEVWIVDCRRLFGYGHRFRVLVIHEYIDTPAVCYVKDIVAHRFLLEGNYIPWYNLFVVIDFYGVVSDDLYKLQPHC
jgi:hypothetical protein